MTLFDILLDNQRVILWSDAEAGLIYTWNYSLTLQCWACQEFGPLTWDEVDIRTLSERPKNARQKLQAWHKERMAADTECPCADIGHVEGCVCHACS